MSTRPQSKPFQVFNATTGQSMAGSLTSVVSVLSNLSMCSYGVSWSGSSPVGTLSVQVSNDYSLNPDGSTHNAGTWNNLPFSISGTPVTVIPISGNTGNGFIDVDELAGYAIRLVYTFGSGTGTLSATFTGKVA